MYYSVCLSAVYSALPLDKAIYKAKAAGVSAVEFWGWWDQDLNLIKKALDDTGLKLTAICTKFTSLVDNKQHSSYLEGLKESVSAAKYLGCNTLITQVGQSVASLSEDEQINNMITGLKLCEPLLTKSGITMVIEPLNILVDHMGYFMYKSQTAFYVAQQVNSPYVKVLYDIYHQQISEGNILTNIKNNLNLIGHFHVAGVPGRHEPMEKNELDYKAVLTAIKEMGFNGPIGLEYFPTGDADKSIKDILNAVPEA